MTNCSSDKYITTSKLTDLVEWQIPTFTDPHDFRIDVTANYLKNEFTFPWGDFNVSYSAVKPSNGLSTDCLFGISLRRKFSRRKVLLNLFTYFYSFSFMC